MLAVTVLAVGDCSDRDSSGRLWTTMGSRGLVLGFCFVLFCFVIVMWGSYFVLVAMVASHGPRR